MTLVHTADLFPTFELNHCETRAGSIDLAARVRELEAEVASLRKIALRDPLTKIGNRRGFELELGKMLARSARHRLPISVLLIDLDHFKELNDTHGHPFGDRVLCAVAAAISSGLRETDYAARLGGDEFG